MITVKKINDDWDTEYHNEDGDIHKANGPAYIGAYNGCWGWYLFGYWHRYYGPSNVYSEWAIHGKVIK